MADLVLNVRTVVQGAQNLRTLSSDLRTTGRNLTLGLTGPLVAAGGAFTAMAAEAEESQTKLESVFDSIGAAAWTSVDALNAHAEAMAASTTFDDDAVKEAQAALLQFGTITGEQFTDATEAAADLAAFMETDIVDAASQLGKILADPEKGMARLTRAGIILTDSQKDAVQAMIDAGDTAGAQAAILDAVSGRIGNVAEDLAETSGGKMAQALNQLGEAGEALGTILLPVLATLAGVLSGLAAFFIDLPEPIQGFIVAVLAIAAAIGPVLLAVSGLIGAFTAVKVAFAAMSVFLLANPFVLLIAALVALVAIIILNWDTIVATVKGALDAMIGFLASFAKGVGDVWQGIMDTISAAWDFITDVFGDATRAIGRAGRIMWKPISDGFDAAIGVVKAIWNAFASFWNSIQISMPSVDIPGVGKVGGFTIGLPDLPFLAEGGIINQPTLAMLGEKGPEAVIPLDQLQQGIEVNVNVQGDLKADERTLPGQILRTLYVVGLGD